MDEEKEMLKKYLGKFIEEMNKSGDADWEEVGNKLGYDRSLSFDIQHALIDKRWLKERGMSQDIFMITRQGLRQARDWGLICDGEYQKLKYDIFDR